MPDPSDEELPVFEWVSLLELQTGHQNLDLSDSVFLSRKAFRNVDWETAGILEILSLKQRSVSFIDKTYLAFWRMLSPVSPKQSCCIWGFLSVLLQSSVPRSIFCSCDFIFPTVKQTWTQTTEANYPTFLGWISISILRRMRMRMMTIWAGVSPHQVQSFRTFQWENDEQSHAEISSEAHLSI